MANYDGIFMRSALNQQNIVPRAGALSNSPDIIPYGISPATDPQKYFSDTYEQDVARSLEGEKTNYVYMRGKNFSGSEINDSGNTRPHLFWTKASLLSYPNKWTELKQTSSGQLPSLKAGAGQVGVISEPFIWVPDNITSDHYCMIAQVPSPGYDNSIPNTLQISDFAGWVAKSGGIAWRNVTVINSTTLTLTDGLSYDQGTEACIIQFTIKCVNVPLNSKISFSSGTPGPTPPIYLAPTIVSTGPSFNTGIECSVPANYATTIYFNLEAPPGVTSLTDATVTMQTSYIVSSASELYSFAKTSAELGIPTVDEAYAMIWRGLHAENKHKMEDYHEQYLQQLIDLHARQSTLKSGPDRMIVVGQNNYNWKTK